MQHSLEHEDHSLKSILRQPKAAWAVAFACVVAFMGLGLVDPILPAIAKQLHATPSQVSLLFTSYMLVTGIAMLITGWTSSRIGIKWTLLLGLILIILFSFLGGFSHTVNEIIWYRAGWGLGNALFISTALAAIVTVATGGTAGAIILFEAAIGLGMSVGPLLGGGLGSISWRGPFFGVAGLMAIGFLAILLLLQGVPKPKRRSSLLDPFRALGHRGLFILALASLTYNFGFFTLLAFSPFVLHMDEHGLGLVFFFWGILLAITSVIIAPKLQERYHSLPIMYVMLSFLALDLAMMGFGVENHTILVVAIVLAGGFLGIMNTVLTTVVMNVSPFERSIASSAYSFVRFTGGAIAPWLAGKLAEWFNPAIPFYVGAIAVIISIITLMSGKRHLMHIDS
nr:MFS transporter [Thermoflavimicrobium dichotomicum]